METILIFFGAIIILMDLLTSISLAAYKYTKGDLPTYVIIGTIVQYTIGFVLMIIGYIIK